MDCPLIVESMRACLSSSGVYALLVVKQGCTVLVLISCIDEGTVRNIVRGTVLFETSWEEDVCQVLANHLSWSNTINGPRACVVDNVRPFSAVLTQKVVGGILLILPRLNLDWLQNLIRGVNYRPFFGVELHGLVDYLRICLESGRKAKVLGMFPGFNAISIKCGVLTAWYNCTG